ncbi:MAG: flagellar motor switch protein FliG [Treponema sp.]|nr:flagellar motor switch protein FliG [Treponema sp.]
MGKSKTQDTRLPEKKAAGGVNASRGIAAYQKIMGKEEQPEEEAGKAGRTGISSCKSKPSGKVPDRNKLSSRKEASPGLKALEEEGLLKTARPLSPKPDSKIRRAAKFLVLVGSDEASRILSHLDPAQVEALSKEIVSIKNIESEEANAVLKEFRPLLSPSYKYSGSSSGGIEEARRHLYAAFGPEKGEAVLVKAVPEAARNPFDFLNDFSGEQLSFLFRDESPAACAMVFSRLSSKLSAAALANIAPERKLDIVRRIARLKETSPEVIERSASALREKARRLGSTKSGGDSDGKIDGKGVLAAILKHSDLAFGDKLLEEIEEEDPSLSREMKDRLYTLEDICAAEDRPIQEKLRTMDDREIALLLHAGSETFTRKILDNLSSNRASQVKQESEIMGAGDTAVAKMDIEAAVKDILSWFRLNRERGRILMKSDEDVLV